jgi:hypothetical protein
LHFLDHEQSDYLNILFPLERSSWRLTALVGLNTLSDEIIPIGSRILFNFTPNAPWLKIGIIINTHVKIQEDSENFFFCLITTLIESASMCSY